MLIAFWPTAVVMQQASLPPPSLSALNGVHTAYMHALTKGMLYYKDVTNYYSCRQPILVNLQAIALDIHIKQAPKNQISRNK